MGASVSVAGSEPVPGVQEVDPPGGLTRAGVRGALWQGLAQVVGKGVVLLTTVVLARLLAPEQFGLVTLALVLIAYAEAIADAGVAQALVYLPRKTSSIQAALACSLVFGGFLFAIALVSAPLAGQVFGRPDMAPLVRLLAVSLVASSVSSVPEALMRRELRYRRLTTATVLRALATGAIAVGLALAGVGAYSLAWGTLAGGATYACSTWLLLEDRPDLRLWRTGRQDIREVLQYALPVAGSSLLGKLIFDIDYLIIGATLGASALAFYTLAFRLPELLIIHAFFALSTVTFPLYSRARSDLARLRSGYLFSVKLQSLYGVCTGVGLAIVAPLLVPLVFGAAWKATVAPLVPLALYAACRSIGAGVNDLYKALGRPRLLMALSIFRLVILCPSLLLATRQGIEGVAWAQFMTSVLFVAVMLSGAVRVVGVTYRDLIHSVAPSLAAGCAVCAVALPLARLSLQPPIVLGITVTGGLAAATGALAVFFPSVLGDLRLLRQREQSK